MAGSRGEWLQDQSDLLNELQAQQAEGRLPPGLAMMMRAKKELRADPAVDLVGGVFLEGETPAPLRRDALLHTYRRVLAGQPSGRRLSIIDEIVVLPAAARAPALRALARGGWIHAGFGLRLLPLMTDGPGKTVLIRAEPGRSTPRHGHTALEYSLVLAGALIDQGRRHGPGDLFCVGPQKVHKPKALAGDICYALTFTPGALRLTGVFGMLQRYWPNEPLAR